MSQRPVWCLRGVTVLCLALPAALGAQALRGDSVARPTAPARARVARPDYRVLRFDEVWARGTGDWSDALKAIPVAPQVALTLGGQARVREESTRDYNFTGTSDDNASSRLQVNVDLQAGDARRVHGRVFAEFRDAQMYHRDLPGGTRPSDGDRSDVQNLFADVAYAKSYVRVGRQEVVSGRERLIGVPDWSNTRRGFQGARAMLVHGALSLDLLDARPVVVRQAAPNLADSTTRFRAVTLGSAPGVKPARHVLPSAWQLYHYDQRVTASTGVHRQTTGGRLAWTFGSAARDGTGYGFETETAMQRGAVGQREIRAWFVTTETSAQWRGVHGSPTLAFGLEAASGDDNPTDGTVRSFNGLYGAAHQHGGYADIIGRANAREAHLVSTWEPSRHLSLRGGLYRYDRLSLKDGVYTKQNTLLRAAGTSRARHAGDELDLTGTMPVTRHLKVIAGHAWIEPGEFMRRSAGGARSARWGYLGTTYTF